MREIIAGDEAKPACLAEALARAACLAEALARAACLAEASAKAGMTPSVTGLFYTRRMSEQSIACPSCGKKIPLTRALRAESETAVRQDFDRQLEEEVTRVRKDTAKAAEKKTAAELAALRDELKTQARELDDARKVELDLRKRERELERRQQDLELTVERKLADARTAIVSETQQRLTEEHRMKDAEKERQLSDMRRQIEDLKRKAEQGSQQLQGEAGEGELEATLRSAFPWDVITPVAQGVRGADVHQVVIDPSTAL